MRSSLQHYNSQQKVDVSGNVLYLTNSTVQIQTIGTTQQTGNEVSWQHWLGTQPLPPHAVEAGFDSDGDLIYVGQAFHNDNLLPAKVIPNAQCALISYDGEEFLKRSCQVLCCENASWVTVKDGIIPANAIPGGYTISGEVLYIGRTHFYGSLTPGRVVRSESKLYIPYGRCEVVSKRFEILVV